jgi:hypothetical protein
MNLVREFHPRFLLTRAKSFRHEAGLLAKEEARVIRGMKPTEENED